MRAIIPEYVVSADGLIMFHGSERFREGQMPNPKREDVNGFRFVEAIIEAGAAGGEIVEYYYDDRRSKETRRPARRSLAMAMPPASPCRVPSAP